MSATLQTHGEGRDRTINCKSTVPMRARPLNFFLFLTLIAAGSAGCDGSATVDPAAQEGRAARGSSKDEEAAMETRKEAQAEKAVDIALEIAVVLGAPGGTLSFTVKNRSTQAFETTPIATNYNRILITPPGGTEFEHFSWKTGIPPVVVQPSQEVSWKVDMPRILEFREFLAPGVHRVRWKVERLVSEEILLLRE
jgi:hypothetical protein